PTGYDGDGDGLGLPEGDDRGVVVDGHDHVEAGGPDPGEDLGLDLDVGALVTGAAHEQVVDEDVPLGQPGVREDAPLVLAGCDDDDRPADVGVGSNPVESLGYRWAEDRGFVEGVEVPVLALPAQHEVPDAGDIAE